jgi:hypothetical protein
MKKQISIYEQALLGLCKKARVKSPLNLVGKKIAFMFYSKEVEVKIFAKIGRVVVSNDKEDGFVSIYLLSGMDMNYPDQLYAVNWNSKGVWEYCCYVNDEKVESYLIESMIFDLKWWQF